MNLFSVVKMPAKWAIAHRWQGGSDMKLAQGCVQVYTGNCKGKTTAALGLAFRAVGRGLKVVMIQFMKGGGPYGEHLAAARLAPDLTIIPTGREGWVNKDDPAEEDITLAAAALSLAKDLNTVDVLNHQYLIVVQPEPSVEVLTKRCVVSKKTPATK